MSPFCNNLRKDDPVRDVLSGRDGKVATTPRESSRMAAVILDGTASHRYLYVKNLRLIVDGKPEDVAPMNGDPGEEEAPTMRSFGESTAVQSLKVERAKHIAELAELERRVEKLRGMVERIDQAITVLSPGVQVPRV